MSTPAENNSLDTPIVVFVSYSHDSEAHQDRVLALSDRLREDGFETILDQYVREPPQNWVVWMNKGIKAAKFVLIIYSTEYSSKSEGVVRSGVGWESILMSGELSFAPAEYAKYIPIFFDEADRSLLPSSLQNASRYVLDQGYADLCAHLSGQSRADRRRLKSLQSRPPLSRKTDFIRPWYVPLNRDPLARGTDQLVEAVHEALRTRRISIIESDESSLVSGPGLALEYAYRYKQDHSAVFWLAGSTEQLTQAYTEIARMPSLQEPRSASEVDSLPRLLGWLQTNRDWLLVLEGEPHQDRVSDFLPLADQGAVIVCTRKRGGRWPANASIISLVTQDDEEIEQGPALAAPRAPSFSRAPKVFLSYRRAQTSRIAEQLLTALSVRGFVVMLERFSLPPGEDFQALLSAELGESDLLIVLESLDSSNSPWLQYEVDYAKRYRMGLASITMPGGFVLSDIPPDHRLLLAESDLTADRGATAETLSRISEFVERRHFLATARRQRYLPSVIESALNRQGLRDRKWTSDGYLEVRVAANARVLIAVQAQSATVHDIYRLSRSTPPGAAAYLVSPLVFSQPDLRDMLRWVADLARVSLLDESQIVALAAKVADNDRSLNAVPRLGGRFILLSAGTPDETIASAVAGLTKAIVAEHGRIVMGGHPGVFRIVTDSAAEVLQTRSRSAEDTPIHVYLSRYFESAERDDALQLAYRQGIATIHWIEAVESDGRSNIYRLRRSMIAETNPLAMLCVGGAEGMLDEVEIFRVMYPNAPVYAFESTGGAAAKIAHDPLAFGGVRVIDRELADHELTEAGYFPYSLITDALLEELADLAGANGSAATA